MIQLSINKRMKLFLTVLVICICLNTISTFIVFQKESTIESAGETLKIVDVTSNILRMRDTSSNELVAEFYPLEGKGRHYPFQGSYKLNYKETEIIAEPLEQYQRVYVENGEDKLFYNMDYQIRYKTIPLPLAIQVEKVMGVYEGPYLKSLVLTNIIILLILFLTIQPISTSVDGDNNERTILSIEHLIGYGLVVVIMIVQVGMVTFDGKIMFRKEDIFSFKFLVLMTPVIINIIVSILNMVAKMKRKRKDTRSDV